VGLPLHLGESDPGCLGLNDSYDLAIEIEQVISAAGNILQDSLADRDPDVIDQIDLLTILDRPTSLSELGID
jgi:hypothetical protein